MNNLRKIWFRVIIEVKNKKVNIIVVIIISKLFLFF